MPDAPTAYAALAGAAEQLRRSGIDDALADARLLLASALGVALSNLDLHLADPIPLDLSERFGTLLRERVARRPLAYVLGDTEFMGLRFRCDPRALVPRPDTEIIVEEVRQRLGRVTGPDLVLDIGAGAGVIGLSLAVLLPRLRVILTDLSPDALALAEENARLLGVTGRAQFLPGPDLDPVAGADLSRGITCLVSNPPYVAPRDIPGLPPEVALHEPRLAWAGEGEEGTGFYERIIPQCPRVLPNLRLAAFEVGIGQAPRVAGLCREAWPGFTVSVIEDLGGIKRVVMAEKRRGPSGLVVLPAALVERSPNQLGMAAEAIREGRLVVFPTDTVYGLAANAALPEAVGRLFEVKGRPSEKALPLLLADADDVSRYARDIPPAAEALIARFWPGPLTIVLRRTEAVCSEAVGGGDTVALRVPRHALARAIIRAAGVPVAVSSANPSGAPGTTDSATVQLHFQDQVAVLVDAGVIGSGTASTVVDLTVTPPRVLRWGGVSRHDLECIIGSVTDLAT